VFEGGIVGMVLAKKLSGEIGVQLGVLR
jgi:hypothetical protein